MVNRRHQEYVGGRWDGGSRKLVGLGLRPLPHTPLVYFLAFNLESCSTNGGVDSSLNVYTRVKLIMLFLSFSVITVLRYLDCIACKSEPVQLMIKLIYTTSKSKVSAYRLTQMF